MTVPLAPLDLLRLYIDDVAPTDGSLPMFTDAELNSALAASNNNPERAAVEGWRWKSAKAAALVDVTEGNASRAMSDMQAHALAMMKHFESSRTGPTEGRTTIGRIKRKYY
jgi:hypothetical protein